MLSNSTRCLLQFKKEIYGAIYYKFRHAFVSYRESLHSRLSAQSCRFVFINQRTFCLQFIALFYVCRQRLHRNHAMKKVLEVISHRLKSHRRCDRIRQVAPICTPPPFNTLVLGPTRECPPQMAPPSVQRFLCGSPVCPIKSNTVTDKYTQTKLIRTSQRM